MATTRTAPLLLASKSPSTPARPPEPALVSPRGFFNARLRAPIPGRPDLVVGEYLMHRWFHRGLVLIAMTVIAVSLVSGVLFPIMYSSSLSRSGWSILNGLVSTVAIGLPAAGVLLLVVFALPQLWILWHGPGRGRSVMTSDLWTIIGLWLLSVPVLVAATWFVALFIRPLPTEHPPWVYYVVIWALPLLGFLCCIVGGVRERHRRLKPPPLVESSSA